MSQYPIVDVDLRGLTGEFHVTRNADGTLAAEVKAGVIAISCEFLEMAHEAFVERDGDLVRMLGHTYRIIGMDADPPRTYYAEQAV